MRETKTFTIEVNEHLFCALNNATIAYNDIIGSCLFRCDVPPKFEPLKTLSDEELIARRDALIDLYNIIAKEFE